MNRPIESCISSVCLTKSEDPAIRWQMALYRDLPNHYEDTTDPEKTVERILDIGHVLFHLEQVYIFKFELILRIFVPT